MAPETVDPRRNAIRSDLADEALRTAAAEARQAFLAEQFYLQDGHAAERVAAVLGSLGARP